MLPLQTLHLQQQQLQHIVAGVTFPFYDMTVVRTVDRQVDGRGLVFRVKSKTACWAIFWMLTQCK